MRCFKLIACGRINVIWFQNDTLWSNNRHDLKTSCWVWLIYKPTTVTEEVSKQKALGGPKRALEYYLSANLLRFFIILSI